MFSLSVPLPSKISVDTALAIIDVLEKIPPEDRKTITYDNLQSTCWCLTLGVFNLTFVIPMRPGKKGAEALDLKMSG